MLLKVYQFIKFSRALKEQGYQSDSTLVFKKRSDVDQLSPVETKVAYKSFQHGGEVPLHGFRKHAPERPKGEKTSSQNFFKSNIHNTKTFAREILQYKLHSTSLSLTINY